MAVEWGRGVGGGGVSVGEGQCHAAGSVVVIVVLGVQAVQDGSSKREDGGAPSQAVPPVKLVIYSQADRLDELDGEKDQATSLQDDCGKGGGGGAKTLPRFVLIFTKL